MANRQRGETTFKVGGQTYTLRYSIDALCQIESLSGKGFVAVLQELNDPQKISLTLIRIVLWAGLQEHHPEVDIKTAGEMIVPAGGAVKVSRHIEGALQAAFPEAKETDARPPKAAQAGTGPNS